MLANVPVYVGGQDGRTDKDLSVVGRHQRPGLPVRQLGRAGRPARRRQARRRASCGRWPRPRPTAWKHSGIFFFSPTAKIEEGKDKGAFGLAYAYQGPLKSAYRAGGAGRPACPRPTSRHAAVRVEEAGAPGGGRRLRLRARTSTCRSARYLPIYQGGAQMLLNAIGWTIEDEALTPVRTKTLTARPLQVDRPAPRWRFRSCNIAGVPAAFMRVRRRALAAPPRRAAKARSCSPRPCPPRLTSGTTPMNRKTLLALATFAGLGILAVIALTPAREGRTHVRSPAPDRPAGHGRHRHASRSPRPAPPPMIKNEGGKYKVTAPVALRRRRGGGQGGVRGAGEDGRLRPGDREEGEAGRVRGRRQERHPRGRQGEGRQGRWPTSIVGKSTGPGTMVRPAGKDEIWQASGISRTCSTRARPTGATRASPPSPPATPSRSRWWPRTAPRRSLKKTGAKAGSRGQVGGRRIVGRRSTSCDNAVPNGIVSARSRSGRRTTSPTAPSWPTRAWTPPALTVTVALKGGKKVTVADRQQEGRRRLLRQDARGAAGVPGQEVQRWSG